MINREDMLELTRRMTPARSHIDRIAGAYYDAEGYIDGTFNTHFLKLSTAEKTKNLELAKAVLQAETNKQLKDYRIPETARKPGSIWQLLDGIKESGLQNDAFLDLLYEMIGERVAPGKESYCFLFHGMYDVPVKGTDKEWQEGSEEVYNYLLVCVTDTCPNMQVSHTEYLDILRKLRNIKGIKKVFIRSGIRFDYLIEDENDEFFRELVKYHISGQLRVAPEHCSAAVLDKMGKPHIESYKRFCKMFYDFTGKEKSVRTYYLFFYCFYKNAL